MYKTDGEKAMDKLIREMHNSDMNITVMDHYTNEEVMDIYNCPKCKLEIALVEAGGPEWDVCRNKDKTHFERAIRLMTRGKAGKRLIMDVVLCDCGYPIYISSKDEGWCDGDIKAIENLSNIDFLPAEHVAKDDKERPINLKTERWVKQEIEFLGLIANKE